MWIWSFGRNLEIALSEGSRPVHFSFFSRFLYGYDGSGLGMVIEITPSVGSGQPFTFSDERLFYRREDGSFTMTIDSMYHDDI